jgi:transcriptional regulator with XRE-family HTH domain
MTEPTGLGPRLTHVRVLRGLTLRELVRRASVPLTTLSQVERGERLTLRSDQLTRLAQVLQVRSDYLLGLSDQMEEEEDTLSEQLATPYA